MHLRLVSGRDGQLLAEHYTSDPDKALAVADLLKLAGRDCEIRGAIALYLAEKAKNGTPRQREIAQKILRRHPFLT
jgi:hypothetical protein